MTKIWQHLAIPVAALCVLTATGCVTGDEAIGTTEPPPTELAPESQPKTSGADNTDCGTSDSGATVTMGTFAPTAGLDPLRVPGTGFNGGTELTAIYDTLTRWDPHTGTYEPHLAQSVEGSTDDTAWTVRLRPGVTFGNGDPLDAQAVIASMTRLSESPYVAGRLFSQVLDMTPVDAMTIKFTLVHPWANFPYLLSMEAGMIVNTRVVATSGADEFNLAPVGGGAGPYEIDHFTPGEEVVMKAKDDYWGGPVCIKTLRFISVRGGQATYDAYRNGEMQLALIRDPKVVDDAKHDGVQGLHALTNAATVLFINEGNPDTPRPASNLTIRQAVADATDVDLIDARVSGGTGLPTSALAHPNSLFSDGELGSPYDPIRAAELVVEAKGSGWDGHLALLCFDDAVSVERCLTLEGLLEAAGMNIDVENTSVSALVQRVVVDHDYDLAVLGFAYDAEPWTALAQYESGSPFSRTGYADVAFDAALAELRASNTAEDTGLALAEAQRVWNETVPSVVLAASDDFVAVAPQIHGLVMTRDSVVMFHDAYIE